MKHDILLFLHITTKAFSYPSFPSIISTCFFIRFAYMPFLLFSFRSLIAVFSFSMFVFFITDTDLLFFQIALPYHYYINDIHIYFSICLSSLLSLFVYLSHSTPFIIACARFRTNTRLSDHGTSAFSP